MKGDWNENDDRFLLQYLNAGMSLYEVAKRMGKTDSQVSTAYSRLCSAEETTVPFDSLDDKVKWALGYLPDKKESFSGEFVIVFDQGKVTQVMKTERHSPPLQKEHPMYISQPD